MRDEVGRGVQGEGGVVGRVFGMLRRGWRIGGLVMLGVRL